MKQTTLTFYFLLFLMVSALQAQGDLEVEGKIIVGTIDTVSAANHVMVRKADGTLAAASISSINEVEELKPFPFNTGFASYNNTYQSPNYYKNNKRVYLQGLVRKLNGGMANGDILGTLPVGYRPDKRLIVTAQHGDTRVRVDIMPDGDVVLWNGSIGANFLSLTGISFSVQEYFGLGDQFAGGYIFYWADPPVDLNGDGILDRGLVAALEDIDSIGAAWGCQGTALPGANGHSIGSGYHNTVAIDTNCAQSNIAAKQCLAYSSGGYTDWYLPSKDELAAMHQHLGGASNIGGFVPGSIDGFYWSSTQLSADRAYDARMDINHNSDWVKYGAEKVRPVRAFQ